MAAVITLAWTQISDYRLEAVHGEFTFTVERRPDWSRYPAMTYRYAASARQFGTALHDLGEHPNSKIARQKCADFINQQAQGVKT